MCSLCTCCGKNLFPPHCTQKEIARNPVSADFWSIGHQNAVFNECMYLRQNVPVSKRSLCYKFSEELSYIEVPSSFFSFFRKACIRIKGHLKLLRIKLLMPFCQAGSNQGNLSHMLYSRTSLKCQP